MCDVNGDSVAFNESTQVKGTRGETERGVKKATSKPGLLSDCVTLFYKILFVVFNWLASMLQVTIDCFFLPFQ